METPLTDFIEVQIEKGLVPEGKIPIEFARDREKESRILREQLSVLEKKSTFREKENQLLKDEIEVLRESLRNLSAPILSGSQTGKWSGASPNMSAGPTTGRMNSSQPNIQNFSKGGNVSSFNALSDEIKKRTERVKATLKIRRYLHDQGYTLNHIIETLNDSDKLDKARQSMEEEERNAGIKLLMDSPSRSQSRAELEGIDPP